MKVSIDYDAQSGVLRLQDDGRLPCGPLVLNAVRTSLSTAGSGLNSFRRDLIRYPAILACAAHCKVLTPAFGVSFSPAMFLAGEPVKPIPRSALQEGVIVVMKLKPDWVCPAGLMADLVCRLVGGLSLKAEFNGVELAQPFALVPGRFTPFAYGHLRYEDATELSEDRLFLNGLPIARSYPWAPPQARGAFWVHLNPEFFDVEPTALHHLVDGDTMLAFLRQEIERIYPASRPQECWA